MENSSHSTTLFIVHFCFGKQSFSFHTFWSLLIGYRNTFDSHNFPWTYIILRVNFQSMIFIRLSTIDFVNFFLFQLQHYQHLSLLLKDLYLNILFIIIYISYNNGPKVSLWMVGSHFMNLVAFKTISVKVNNSQFCRMRKSFEECALYSLKFIGRDKKKSSSRTCENSIHFSLNHHLCEDLKTFFL